MNDLDACARLLGDALGAVKDAVQPGRRIATLPGYNFSPALKKLTIVWSKETVSKLFEIGPAHYTPGTKMPEQTIGSEADRKALVDFLGRVTN